jgi:hypothetical protein
MILILERDIKKEDKERLIEGLKAEDLMVKEIQGVEEVVLGVVGKIPRERRHYESLPGVSQALPVSQPFKLVSREMHPKPSIIKVRDVEIGGDRLVVIAGPCGVEERSRTLEIARAVRSSGAVLFRGGAFKPRTSPYSFQGLGRGGAQDPGPGTGGNRHGGGQRDDHAQPGRPHGQVCGRGPGRRAQYAEFRASENRGAHGQAGAPKTRPVRHYQGLADGRRVHRVRGQRPDHPLRAGYPHLRDPHPQHPGSYRGAGDAKSCLTCPSSSTPATPPVYARWWPPWPGPQWPPGPTG